MTIVAGTRVAYESVSVNSADISGQALEASDDGKNYEVVVDVPRGGSSERTLSFKPVTARYFRLTVKAPPRIPGLDPTTELPIAELVLYPGPRVNRFEDKAAFSQVPDLYVLPTPNVTAGDAIDRKSVIDLTGKMHPDGSLNWTPPPGKWNVLRIGYSRSASPITPQPKKPPG